MNMDVGFYLAVIGSFMVAGIIFNRMMTAQARKEHEEELRFQQVLHSIESKYRDKEEQ